MRNGALHRGAFKPRQHSTQSPPSCSKLTVDAHSRNPFDVWVRVVAAVLTALGVYFLSATIMHERAFMEATPMGQGGAM